MKIFIYALMHPITKDVRYVGKTKYHPNDRLISHLREVSTQEKGNFHSKNWIRSLLKEGLIPALEILEECTDDDWVEREIFWISYYKGIDCDLTNMTDGGDGNRGKMPDTYKNPQNIPVDIYDTKGNFIKECESLKAAEIFTGCHNGKISSICKGKERRHSCCGYVFRYKGMPFEREKPCAKGVKVFVLDNYLNLIKICVSSAEAETITGVSDGVIRQICEKQFYKNGDRIFNNGFTFLHEKDYMTLTDQCSECNSREGFMSKSNNKWN